MQKIVIIGAGGLGREVADVIAADNAQPTPRWELVGFIDQDPEKKGLSFNGVPVLGGFEALQGLDVAQLQAITGVGNTAARRRLVAQAQECGLTFANVVHPAAIMTPHIAWGQGIVVTAGVILTNTIQLGDHVFLNLSVTVGHDAVIDDYCNLAPGVHISGNVHLHEGCDLGTGAATVQGITVGHWTIVGAGSVLVRDVPPNVTIVGVPGRIVKERPEGWQLFEH